MDIAFVWLARLMYLGVFLLAGGMYYRAGKILLARDLRYVADWRGRTLPEPHKWTGIVAGINVLGASALLAIGVLVLLVGLPFSLWTGAAALVMWTYYFLLRVTLHRAAHGAGRARST